MNEKTDIKRIVSVLSIIGLTILLLVSPCKVRNYIEAELDVPQTEVYNKSKSTLNNSNCSTSELSQINQTISQPQSQQTFFLSPASSHFVFEITDVDAPAFPISRKDFSNATVPLYILYRNIKAFL